VLQGFAIDDDSRHAYEALGPGQFACGDTDSGPCELRRAGPLTFRRAPSLRRAP